jgi:hypothetical protein
MSVNLQLDRALIRCDRSHIVTDTGTIVREEYTSHGLHTLTPENIIKQETGDIHVKEQMPSLLINNEKIKYPEKVVVCNGFFLPTAENLNVYACYMFCPSYPP